VFEVKCWKNLIEKQATDKTTTEYTEEAEGHGEELFDM
jgi:hypothetical protein